MSEWDRIAALRRIFEADGAPEALRLGIGDDAAVLDVSGALVVSVDAAVEHVHFEREWLSMEALGYRATVAALSDLAAMGAVPAGVLGSWALPRDVTDADLEAMANGQAEACREVGTRVIGGNLARGADLSLHTTVLGQVDNALRRDGARPGDVLMVAGELGWAAAGLAALQRGEREGRFVQAWRRRFVTPEHKRWGITGTIISLTGIAVVLAGAEVFGWRVDQRLPWLVTIHRRIALVSTALLILTAVTGAMKARVHKKLYLLFLPAYVLALVTAAIGYQP